MSDREKAIVTFKMLKRNIYVDIEIPLDISADDLIKALNVAYSLEIDTTNPKNCFIQSENPIALLKGNRLLKDFGVHNGTVISFSN